MEKKKGGGSGKKVDDSTIYARFRNEDKSSFVHAHMVGGRGKREGDTVFFIL